MKPGLRQRRICAVEHILHFEDVGLTKVDIFFLYTVDQLIRSKPFYLKG